MNYNHLSIYERSCVYHLKKKGMSIREIAKAIERSPSTISREIKRNKYLSNGMYHPTSAQNKYLKRRLLCHSRNEINEGISKYIEAKIKLTWSPQQIAKRSKLEKKLCPFCSTIYRWIHQGLLIKIEMKRLRRKGKFKRPQEVYKRLSIGHWKAGTVESGRINHQRKSKACFVTLAERKSRLYLAMLLPDRTEENVTKAIINMLSEYPKDAVKTITCDRGKEFAGYDDNQYRYNYQGVRSRKI